MVSIEYYDGMNDIDHLINSSLRNTKNLGHCCGEREREWISYFGTLDTTNTTLTLTLPNSNNERTDRTYYSAITILLLVSYYILNDIMIVYKFG